MIGPDGAQLGIKTVPDALALAREIDLDLVEVAPLATPPVCRIMDYGKFRYEESQRAREARKKTAHVSVKEVKFRPKIGKGHKVKVSLQFRGREMAHPELGSKILDDVIEQILSVGKVETQARLEGRSMTMVLVPDKKPVKKEKPVASESSAVEAEVLPTETPVETPVIETTAPATDTTENSEE